MSLVKTLKFVRGSVSKKTALPELNHFVIADGRVTGYNGMLSISCNVDCDIDCSPKADMLVKAIENCEDTVQLSLTPAGSLRVVSGAFRALVPCVDREVFPPGPEGVMVPVDSDVLLKTLKLLEPFIGDDAAKPWVNGVLFRNQSAYATCNVVAVQRWMGFSLPHEANVPASAIREVLRIGEVPTALQVSRNSVTFHYESGNYIRTNLFSSEWPDIDRILDRAANPTPVDERIFTALEKVKSFTDKTNRVLFSKDRIHTHEDLQEGCAYELPGSDLVGIYSLDKMLLLKGVAKQADFTAYPNPCVFYGDMIRGVIIGRKF